MPVDRKKCNNRCKTSPGRYKYYTHGCSPSPYGLGFCNNCGYVGEIRYGYDNKKWIRKQYSNGNKWVLLKVKFNKILELHLYNKEHYNVKKINNRRSTPKKIKK